MPKKSAYAELTVFAAGFALILGLVLVFKDGDKALSTPEVNAIGWLGLAATAGLAIHEYHAITRLLGSYAGSRIGTGLSAV